MENNITKIIGSYEKHTYAERTAPNRRTELNEERQSPSGKASSSTDSVSLSLTSKEMHAAKEAVMSAMNTSPAVDREMKIAHIAQAVRQGTYQIDFDKIAEKMIGSVDDNLEAW